MPVTNCEVCSADITQTSVEKCSVCGKELCPDCHAGEGYCAADHPGGE